MPAQKKNRKSRNPPKKVTKAKKKVAFGKSRRPFVEVKSRSHSELWITLGGDPTTHPQPDIVLDPRVLRPMVGPTPIYTPLISAMLPVWSYYNPVQGVTEKDMIGSTLTCKYLTAKLMFNFPDNVQLKNPRYYIIHGFIKTAPDNTAYTTPNRTSFTRPNLIDHIFNTLKEDFDEHTKNEFLQYKEKQNKDYIVIGYRRIRPSQEEQQITPFGVSIPSTDALAMHGKPSPKNIHLKWPVMNRKVKFTKGTDNSAIIVGGTPFFYDNNGTGMNGTPFILYYCPDAGQLVANGIANSPSIAYDNKLWFTDS